MPQPSHQEARRPASQSSNNLQRHSRITNPSFIMDEKPEPPFQFIYNYVDQDTFTKYLRLTIIVCIYIFLRGYYSNWSKQRQVKNQIDLDNKLKAEEKKREEQKEEEKLENLDNEAKSFGWGKATRRNVKRQEKILQDAAEEIRERKQTAYDAAEDHDIDDLLEWCIDNKADSNDDM